MGAVSSDLVEAIRRGLREEALGGIAETSRAALATRHGVSARTIANALRELRDRGFLEVTRTRAKGRVAGLRVKLPSASPSFPQLPLASSSFPQLPLASSGRPKSNNPIDDDDDVCTYVSTYNDKTIEEEKNNIFSAPSKFPGSCEASEPSKTSGDPTEHLRVRQSPSESVSSERSKIAEALDRLERLLSSSPLTREATSTPTLPERTAALPVLPASVPLTSDLAAHPANSRAAIQPLPEPSSDEGRSVEVAKALAISAGRSEQAAEAFALQCLSKDPLRVRRALQATVERQNKDKAQPLRDPLSYFWKLYSDNCGVEGGNWESFTSSIPERPPEILPGKKVPPVTGHLEWTEDQSRAWNALNDQEKAIWKAARQKWLASHSRVSSA